MCAVALLLKLGVFINGATPPAPLPPPHEVLLMFPVPAPIRTPPELNTDSFGKNVAAAINASY